MGRFYRSHRVVACVVGVCYCGMVISVRFYRGRRVVACVVGVLLWHGDKWVGFTGVVGLYPMLLECVTVAW